MKSIKDKGHTFIDGLSGAQFQQQIKDKGHMQEIVRHSWEADSYTTLLLYGFGYLFLSPRAQIRFSSSSPAEHLSSRVHLEGIRLS